MQHSMISTALAAVSLRDLALVQAVHRHGSFNHAARAMHISPSGLSHQVQKVEQALGVPLFERGARRVTATAVGTGLLARIAAVLDAAADLQHLARAGEIAFGGELRLGVLASLGPYLLPHLITPFPQHFPGARLALSEGKAKGLLRRLQETELDAVLLPLADMPGGIRATPLFFEPWDVMVRADHPLAARRQVALAQLDRAEATLMAESHADDASGHLQDVSLESLAALVRLRGGHAFVPTLARERLASVPGITLASLRGAGDAADAGRAIALYWRETSPWRDDLERFATLLRAVAKQRPRLRLLDAAPAMRRTRTR
jgi:LysR family hydrogen peroxide-inducible transcriptional activator